MNFLQEEPSPEDLMHIEKKYSGKHLVDVIIESMTIGLTRPETIRDFLSTVPDSLMTPYMRYGWLSAACGRYVSEGTKHSQDMIPPQDVKKYGGLKESFALLAHQEKIKLEAPAGE